MLKKIKVKVKNKKIIFLNKKETKKIIKKNIKKKYILEIYSGFNYIINSLVKKIFFSKLLSVEKEKNNFKIINKFIPKKNNIKKMKKKKYNLIIMNPPYLKYYNSNIKKINFLPIKSLTNFKKKIKLKKNIKIKNFLKKNAKIKIENKKWKKKKTINVII